jgi:hypothetical protein
VHIVEHQTEQVLGGGVAAGPPLLQHLIDHVLHVLSPPFLLGVLAAVQEIGAGRAAQQALVVGQRFLKRHHERVRFGAAERAEVVAEAGPPDRVEGQGREVAGDVDRAPVPRGGVPPSAQLVGHSEHGRVVGVDLVQGERGDEDVVGLGPVRLVVERGEQPVADDAARQLQAGSDELGEEGVVAEVGGHVDPAGQEHPAAERLAGDEAAQLVERRHQVEHPAPGGVAADVADQREPAAAEAGDGGGRTGRSRRCGRRVDHRVGHRFSSSVVLVGRGPVGRRRGTGAGRRITLRRAAAKTAVTAAWSTSSGSVPFSSARPIRSAWRVRASCPAGTVSSMPCRAHPSAMAAASSSRSARRIPM